MKTGDLYQIMMSTVCRHTGVGELDMIESNKEECVDARYILIYFLSKYLTDEDIIEAAYAFWFDDEDWMPGDNKIWSYMCLKYSYE